MGNSNGTNPGPQAWQDQKMTELPRQDNDIGQKYVFSSTKFNTEEITYQLNNLMELTNRVLINCEGIQKPGTDLINPDNVSSGDLYFILKQIQETLTEVDEGIRRMDATQTKVLFSPETSWAEKMRMVVSSIALAAANQVAVNYMPNIMEYIGLYSLYQACIRSVMHRIAGNNDFEPYDVIEVRHVPLLTGFEIGKIQPK
ncbi:hypothetical protein ACB094_07G002600 [Castanea mollissima]